MILKSCLLYDGQVVLINRNLKYVLVFERNKSKSPVTNYFTWRNDYVTT